MKQKSGTNAEIEKYETEIQTAQERKSELQQKIDKEHKTDYSTNDLNAPQLYSKRVVMLFSAIFSTIFGAVLMMSNFKFYDQPELQCTECVLAIRTNTQTTSLTAENTMILTTSMTTNKWAL